jgi:hypothetical protein
VIRDPQEQEGLYPNKWANKPNHTYGAQMALGSNKHLDPPRRNNKGKVVAKWEDGKTKPNCCVKNSCTLVQCRCGHAVMENPTELWA